MAKWQVELAQEAVRGYTAASKARGSSQKHLGAFTKRDELKRCTIIRRDEGGHCQPPKVLVGGIERRVLWYRRVERTQEERDAIAEAKGDHKVISKKGWREWSPPALENVLIVRVDEEVGGMIHIERDAKPGEVAMSTVQKALQRQVSKLSFAMQAPSAAAPPGMLTRGGSISGGMTTVSVLLLFQTPPVVLAHPSTPALVPRRFSRATAADRAAGSIPSTSV